MKGIIFSLIILVTGTVCKAQPQADEQIWNILSQDQLGNFGKVELRNNSEIYYDSTFSKKVFGKVPKEVLISGLPFLENHIQINYEFSSINCPGNGYGPTTTIIDEISWMFGNPSSVEWSNNSIDVTWKSKGINISLKHFDLEAEELILVRLDLRSESAAIADTR